MLPRSHTEATRGTAPPELHIASLVVHAAPIRVDLVADAVAAIPGAQIHARGSSGKLVVTLDAATADEMMAKVTGIQRMDGVLSAMLVYQCNDTLDSMNEELPDGDHQA